MNSILLASGVLQILRHAPIPKRRQVPLSSNRFPADIWILDCRFAKREQVHARVQWRVSFGFINELLTNGG